MSLIEQLNLLRRRIVFEGETFLTEEYLSLLEHTRDEAFSSSAADYQGKVDSVAASYRTLSDLDELSVVMTTKRDEANDEGEKRYDIILQRIFDAGLLGETSPDAIRGALKFLPGVVKALVVSSIGSALLMYTEVYTGRTPNLTYEELLLPQEENTYDGT